MAVITFLLLAALAFSRAGVEAQAPAQTAAVAPAFDVVSIHLNKTATDAIRTSLTIRRRAAFAWSICRFAI